MSDGDFCSILRCDRFTHFIDGHANKEGQIIVIKQETGGSDEIASVPSMLGFLVGISRFRAEKLFGMVLDSRNSLGASIIVQSPALQSALRRWFFLNYSEV